MSHSFDLDLEHILVQGKTLWGDLRRSRIFITGGTGFFGCWLLESFLKANRELGLDARMTVLTRDEKLFREKRPHLASASEISFYNGDVRDFNFPPGDFTHIIHAATDSSVILNQENPSLMLDTIVGGARRVLEFAAARGVKNLLLTSSGAVYGRQPDDMIHIPESYMGGPDPIENKSAYAEGKRMAELTGAIMAKQSGLEIKIARCFAFVGPYMSFDGHFAIGNFIKNAVEGRPILVSGDGSTRRSYLYAADLAVWLWTILLRGQSLRPYNVGSEERVSILELAQAVQSVVNPAVAIQVQQKSKPGFGAGQYVPSTKRAREELSLRQTIDLPESIRRTADLFLKSGSVANDPPLRIFHS